MAKILTPDEVKKIPQGALCWMEFRFRCGDTLYRIHLLEGHRTEKRMSEYGRTWRVWSDKPTDEQREAVKWNG